MAKDIQVEFGSCPFQRKPMRGEVYKELIEDLTPSDDDFQTGNLYFGAHSSDVRHIPFISTPCDKPSNYTISKILREWELNFPRIVMFVIASTKKHNINEHQIKLKNFFIKGLIDALNTTEMWLCMDGLHTGFNKDFGKALSFEKSRKEVLLTSSKKTSYTGFPETAVIGICSQEALKFSDKLRQTTTVKTEGSETGRKYDINRNFEYFIFVKDHTKRKRGLGIFFHNFASCLKQNVSLIHKETRTLQNVSEIPVLAILFHGEVSDIDAVRGHLKNLLPLVIIEGSGGLADLLAFAHFQLTYCPDSSNIAEYTETVLKPQLQERIHNFYPDFTEFLITERDFCEKIYDCIRYSKQNNLEFITLIALHDLEKEHADQFPAHLLRALCKAHASDKETNVFCLKRDLFLAMDWNSPDVAKAIVFDKDLSCKFQVDNETFFRAIIKPHREKFISLFISQGFVVHKFLNSSILIELFHESLKKEFFKTIVWETIFGFGVTSELSRHFIDTKLVLLLEELTGIPSLINAYELDWNCRGIYDYHTPEQAERKAIIVLALWAILSNRVNLVKNIGMHCEQPIELALVCSLILRKLRKYVSDLGLKTQMGKESKEFSSMATTLITMCYQRFPSRALDLLSVRNGTWSYVPLIEIAAFAENREFMAHICCQRFLDNKFFGCIKIRDLPYGDVTIPTWLKIILISFFVFPMFLWVEFEFPEKSNAKSLKSDQTLNSNSIDKKGASNSPSEYSRFNKLYDAILLFFLKVYYFYNTPVSKFWVSRVFYLVFLAMFSFAVIFPACGSLYLDFASCLWILIFVIDSIIHVIILAQKYPSMRLMSKYIEILLLMIFFILYMGSRVFRVKILSQYSAKVMLCLALLFFYYRLIFNAFPISPSLGPMLYRTKRMAFIDFANFMRVTALVLISNGIAIQAIIYPDYPLGWELFRKTFFNGLVAFFLLPADNFGNPDMTCVGLRRHPNGQSFYGLPENVCRVGRYYDTKCPNPGIWPYIFVLQYLLVLRLILLTLLYAIYSNTQIKLFVEGNTIWKYERYDLVMDHANRLVFPAPLSPISYCILILRYFYGLCRVEEKEKSPELTEIDYLYLKCLAWEYFQDQQREKDNENSTKFRMESMFVLMDALNVQRRSMQDIQSYLTRLRIQINNAHRHLQNNALQVSLSERLLAQNIPQILSRISPYPYTNISRFPVSDNRVNWSSSWMIYDPIAFTTSKYDFPLELREHVDIDIQKLRELLGEDFRMPVFMWNTSTLSPGGIFLDRMTWILKKRGTPFQYELDDEGLPRNPVGRTGIRGRGRLPHWGPNHYIYVIITRWQEDDTTKSHNYLDILVMFVDSELFLPGGFVVTEDIYEVIRLLFKCETPWKSEDDMIGFFKLLAEPPPTTEPPRAQSPSILDFSWMPSFMHLENVSLPWLDKVPSTTSKTPEPEKEDSGLVYERLRKGYMDEATNTDQAWCEAEVWHFHYNKLCRIKEYLNENMQWVQLNEFRLKSLPPGQAAFVHTVARKMKAFLEIS